MINRLASLLSLRFGHPIEPFEGYIDHVPVSPPAIEPPAPRWHVTLPGKYRAYSLVEKETEADAITALEEIAANFAEEGWTLIWETEQRCHMSKECSEGVLSSLLEVQPGGVLAS